MNYWFSIFVNLSVRKDLYEVMTTHNVIRSPPRFLNAVRGQEAEANVQAHAQEDFRCTWLDDYLDELETSKEDHRHMESVWMKTLGQSWCTLGSDACQVLPFAPVGSRLTLSTSGSACSEGI